MKILQLKTSANCGGAEVTLLNVTTRAVALGHEVTTVLAESGWLSRQLTDRQLSCVVPCAGRGRWLAFVRIALKLARMDRPDVILAHGARVNLVGTIVARLVGVPSVAVEQNVDAWRVERPLWQLTDRAVGALNTKRIAVSGAVRDMLVADRVVAAERVVMIPNVIEPAAGEPADRGRIRERFGLRPDDVVVVAVGRLVRQKGHAHLIEAAARIAPRWPNLKVLVMGDGPLRAELEHLGRTLAFSDRLVLAGMLEHVPALLPAFDVFVLPSLWEGLPLALIEALQAGLPVIATTVAGVPEVIRRGENGLLVAPGDATALATALEHLLENPALAARLGARAAESARDWVSVDRQARQYLAVLDEVIVSHSGADRACLGRV